MLPGNLPLNIVHGTCATVGFRPRLSRKKKRKQEAGFQSVSCSFRRSLLSSPVSSRVVRLVARQRNRHGREEHEPPVRSCNVRHSSFCRDTFTCAKLQDIRLRVYLISYTPRARKRVCAFRATSERVCALLRHGTAEHEYFSGLVQTFRKCNGFLCNQIIPVFPLRFKSPSKPSTLSSSFLFHGQHHPNNGPSHVLIW